MFLTVPPFSPRCGITNPLETINVYSKTCPAAYPKDAPHGPFCFWSSKVFATFAMPASAITARAAARDRKFVTTSNVYSKVAPPRRPKGSAAWPILLCSSKVFATFATPPESVTARAAAQNRKNAKRMIWARVRRGALLAIGCPLFCCGLPLTPKCMDTYCFCRYIGCPLHGFCFLQST